MSLKITQETFNEAVMENMSLFECSLEDSIRETYNMFECQGANLVGIIRDTNVVNGVNPVDDIKEKLLHMSDEEASKKISLMKELTDIVRKNVAYKLYCGNNEIYDICFGILNSTDNEELRHAIMDFLLVLMDGFPDILDERGAQYFISLLDKDETSQQYGLKLIRVTCIRHAINRERYMEADICPKLTPIASITQSDTVLILLSKAIVSLTLDDDVRSLMSKSYANAVALADCLLKPLCYLLKVKKDPATVQYLMKALTTFAVNFYYCSDIDNEGGLAAALNILEKNRHKQKVVSQCFKLLSSIVGNEQVKENVMKYDVAPEIHSSLISFGGNKDLVHSGLLLISKICLRGPEYGKLFFKLDFPELIVQAMNRFSDDYTIQVTGCWCIRNMSCRNPEYHKQFLQIGAEEILRRIASLDECCSYDAKMALNSLGCHVVAREPWTGKEGDKLAKHAH